MYDNVLRRRVWRTIEPTGKFFSCSSSAKLVLLPSMTTSLTSMMRSRKRMPSAFVMPSVFSSISISFYNNNNNNNNNNKTRQS